MGTLLTFAVQNPKKTPGTFVTGVHTRHIRAPAFDMRRVVGKADVAVRKFSVYGDLFAIGVRLSSVYHSDVGYAKESAMPGPDTAVLCLLTWDSLPSDVL